MVVRVECYPRKARFSLLFEKERFLGRYLVRSIKMEDGGVEWAHVKKGRLQQLGNMQRMPGCMQDESQGRKRRKIESKMVGCCSQQDRNNRLERKNREQTGMAIHFGGGSSKMSSYQYNSWDQLFLDKSIIKQIIERKLKANEKQEHLIIRYHIVQLIFNVFGQKMYIYDFYALVYITSPLSFITSQDTNIYHFLI